MYLVFGKKNCKFCKIAKELLQIYKLDYQYKNIDTKSSHIPKYLKDFIPDNHNTVPIIFLKNKKKIKFIGGTSDLYFHLNKN